MPTEAEAADTVKHTDGATRSHQEDKAEKQLNDQHSSKRCPTETESENLIANKAEAEDVTSKNQDRLQRFKALQARAVRKPLLWCLPSR